MDRELLEDALRTAAHAHSRSETEARRLVRHRDRLIVACKADGMSLREIAAVSGLHHTRIAQVLQRPEAAITFASLTGVEQLQAPIATVSYSPAALVPEIPDWNTVAPQVVRSYLRRFDRAPATRETWQSVLDMTVERIPQLKGNPPKFVWSAAWLLSFAQNAAEDPCDNNLFDVLQTTRIMMQMATERVAIVGEDLERQGRERWLSALSGLADQLEADQQEDWRMQYVSPDDAP